MCPLVSLAIYISTLEESHFEKRTSLFGMNNGASAKRLRKLINTTLEGTNKRLATHSIRKHAATYCEQMGVAREVVNYRGRWRRIKRLRMVQALLEEMNQPILCTITVCCKKIWVSPNASYYL